MPRLRPTMLSSAWILASWISMNWPAFCARPSSSRIDIGRAVGDLRALIVLLAALNASTSCSHSTATEHLALPCRGRGGALGGSSATRTVT